MVIRAIDWTPERVDYLRRVLRAADRNGWHNVTLPGGQRVTLDYARHVLACLEETQTDSVSGRA